MATAYDRHRISVDEYCRMYDAGVFAPDARLELIDGELIERVAPVNPPHISSVMRITRLLVLRLADRALIGPQVSVILTPFSEPEPDISVLRLDPRDYVDATAGPADIYLLIEVADSSRDFDRSRKMPLYARAGVKEAWIVDLVDDVVAVYRNPASEGYANITVARRGEDLAIEAFPDIRLPVDDLLPLR